MSTTAAVGRIALCARHREVTGLFRIHEHILHSPLNNIQIEGSGLHKIVKDKGGHWKNITCS